MLDFVDKREERPDIKKIFQIAILIVKRILKLMKEKFKKRKNQAKSFKFQQKTKKQGILDLKKCCKLEEV